MFTGTPIVSVNPSLQIFGNADIGVLRVRKASYDIHRSLYLDHTIHTDAGDFRVETCPPPPRLRRTSFAFRSDECKSAVKDGLPAEAFPSDREEKRRMVDLRGIEPLTS